jgi:hypothetical protein
MAFTEISTDIFSIDGIDGAAFLLDCTGDVPVAPLFPFLSSTDASQLQFSPKIPDGVTLGPRIARQFGFRWVMSNGWELWALDAQASKPAEHLGYAAPGWRFVFRMPKDDFPSAGPDDVHRIDKLVMSGHHEFYKFLDQPELTPEEVADGDERPFPRSIEIYHKTKCNNVLASDGVTLINDYKRGKAGRKLPPMAFSRNSSTGEVGPPIYGFWEHSVLPNADYLGTKCWDKATVQAALAGAGQFDEILVDATLGVTTLGASARTPASLYYATNAGQSPDDAEVDSITFAARVDGACRCAIYAETPFGTTNPRLANSDTTERTPDSSVADGIFFWLTWNYATKPQLTNGETYHVCVHRNRGYSYDATGGSTFRLSLSVQSPAPDPSGAGWFTGTELISSYITFTPTVPPGGNGVDIIAGSGDSRIIGG